MNHNDAAPVQTAPARNVRSVLGVLAALIVGCGTCLIPMLLAGGAVGGLGGLLGTEFGWITGGMVLLLGMVAAVYMHTNRKAARAMTSTASSKDGSCRDSGCGC